MSHRPHLSALKPRSAASVPPVPPPQGRLHWRWVVDGLSADGLLDEPNRRMVEGRLAAGDSAQHPFQRIGGMGVVSAKDGSPLDVDALTAWLAERAQMGVIRIDPLKSDPGRVADVMSHAFAERCKALPVQVGAQEVVVATSEPFDTGWVPEIEAHTKRRVKLMVANPLDLQRFTAEFYMLSSSVRAAQKAGDAGGSSLASFEQLVELGKTRTLDANDQSVVQVVDWLWQYAFDQRASDIHMEPRRDVGVIRFRIDGVMHNVYQLPLTVLGAMTARIKLLGRMDMIERRRPQDGRIKTRNPKGTEIEMRLSTLPTAFGEKLVMRIFDPESASKQVAALGFSAQEAARWEQLTGQAHGIILVTGPTGSGKTTTLYATLKRLATEEVNVCTIEDPIEMIEPSLNQTQVQPSVDLSFAEGLRALMRQDPDIIMVGEIRDLETAEMAVQASLTGHLVFSTLHTNDAAAAITRMLDLGVPSYLISATVIGVLAQRLVRVLCPSCKEPDPALDPETLVEMAKPWRLGGRVRPYRAVGCADCRHTGFKGRAGLYELMQMSEAIKPMIKPQLELKPLRKQAAREGMVPLRLSGLMKVAEGLTTLDEVLKATPPWNN